MKIHPRSAKIYLLLHAGVILLLSLFPLYRAITDRIPQFLSGCFLHDRLFLYCPLCGGTRALSAILQLDFVAAFHYNPFVMLVAVLAVALDIFALTRLLRGRSDLLPLPGWVWIVLVVVMIGYAILRNYLMIAHGYDPVGDLGVFWNR